MTDKLLQLKTNLNLLPKSPVGHLTELHLPFLREILDKVKPKKILEFGFNAGHSSTIFLTLTDAEVISADPGNAWVWVGSNEVKEMFGKRFKFFNTSSQDSELYQHLLSIQYQPDLVFVDGDHSYEGCYRDLELSFKFSSEYILVDNLEDTDNVGNAVNKFCEDYPYEKVLVEEITETKQRLALLKKKKEVKKA